MGLISGLGLFAKLDLEVNNQKTLGGLIMKALTLALCLMAAGSFAMAEDAAKTATPTTTETTATATTPAAVPGKKVAKAKKHHTKAPAASATKAD